MNKKTLFTVVIVCVCAVVYGFCLHPARAEERSEKSPYIEVTWLEDFDEGLKTGRDQDKPVLVDFTSEQMLKPEYQVAFTSPPIVERLVRDWICVRLNSDDFKKKVYYNDKEMKLYELKRYFRLGTPALLFLDKDSEPVQIISAQKLFEFYKDKEFLGFILDYIRDEAYMKDIAFKEFQSMNE
ncbi:MAG: hypothetical protein JXB48_03850 [Candidatus Latescibacteria bacterium]|nr:hypothetical protein [Candidatus Latescibacterota bacterium]